jgi:hypothetical protein
MGKRASAKTSLRPAVAKSGKAAALAAGAKVLKARGILIKVNDTGWRSLRLLAFDRDSTLQALGIEALNDLLKKYGKPSIVENPLLGPADSE